MEFGVNGESSNTRCPRIADFINEILPQLEIMSVEPEPTITPPGNLKPTCLYSLNNLFLQPRKHVSILTNKADLFSELTSPANGTSLAANNVIPVFIPGIPIQGLPLMPLVGPPRMIGPIPGGHPGMPFPIPGHPPMMPFPIPGMPFPNPGQPGMMPFPGGRMPPPEVLARMVPPGTTTTTKHLRP